MAQGLQCWDAHGRLVVDLGDYNIRYMGSASLNVAAGTNNWVVNFNGVRPDGWIIIVTTSDAMTEFYCIPQTNSFNVKYTPVNGSFARTINFELYTFI